MTLGGELGGEGGNPWHHLLGASLNLSNVYVSCYTHMQMELYCSQLAAVSRHLPQLMGLCYAMNRLSFSFVCAAMASFGESIHFGSVNSSPLFKGLFVGFGCKGLWY